MKKALFVLTLVFLLCLGSACRDKAVMAEPERAEIVKAIEAGADDIASAISRLDAEEVTNLFSKIDGTKYISDGAYIPRDDLRKTFRNFYGALREMKFAFEKKEVLVLNQDVAVLTGWAHYTAVTKENQIIDERALFTSVYIRANGKWSILQSHKSLIN